MEKLNNNFECCYMSVGGTFCFYLDKNLENAIACISCGIDKTCDYCSWGKWKLSSLKDCDSCSFKD